jgi:AcrR family transcriptional regulator
LTEKKFKKRDITRTKVISAAIDCIYRDGFNAAHTNRIAEAAGVSWGVLQYHFGDKDGLLQAVLDSIFENFLDTLKNTQLTEDDLHQRLSQLIDVVWTLVSKKEYRVSIAILRNAGKDRSSNINGDELIARWSGAVSNLWSQLIGEEFTNTGSSEIARHLMFASLRGLADDINPGNRLTAKSGVKEREALSEAIAYLLTKA